MWIIKNEVAFQEGNIFLWQNFPNKKQQQTQ